jgi:hypothetical protein
VFVDIFLQLFQLVLLHLGKIQAFLEKSRQNLARLGRFARASHSRFPAGATVSWTTRTAIPIAVISGPVATGPIVAGPIVIIRISPRPSLRRSRIVGFAGLSHGEFEIASLLAVFFGGRYMDRLRQRHQKTARQNQETAT